MNLTVTMIKLGVIIGLCAAVRCVETKGNFGNATKGIKEQENNDNVAESSDSGGNLFDLGSVSSGLLSSGLNLQNGWTPISTPISNIEPNQKSDEHVKTITVTKNVPVPYTVTVEKRIPVRIEVPVDKPYPVYVPRPYQVVVEKKVPYEVKVPVPQPYTVEKRVPVPVKVHVSRPYPVHVPAPYPVYMVRKVPYTIEKHIPYPVGVPVVRPYPVHVPVEKHVPFPVEKTVPYPVRIHVERPVPIPVDKPYPVHVEKHVPVPVEKLIPVPVKIPVRIPIKIPIPIPVTTHHTHEGSPPSNEYYIHEQLIQQARLQESQYHSEGEEVKEQENTVGESGTLVRHEVPVGVEQQQNHYHYETIPEFQQPQVYGTYGEPQQQENAFYIAPHKPEVATENLNHQPVVYHGYSYHQQDEETYRNEAKNQQQENNLYIAQHKPEVVTENHQPVVHHGYAYHQQDEETYRNVAKNQQQFLSVDDYSKALNDQYNIKQLKHEGNNKTEVHEIHGGAKDEYEALKAQSDDGKRKQESYFKVNIGSSAYTNSVHHGLKTTGS